MPPLTRRQMLAMAGGAGLAWMLGRAVGATVPLHIGLILPADDPWTNSVQSGASLGADEANRLAELMRTEFTLTVTTVESEQSASDAAAELVASGASAIFGGLVPGYSEAIASAAPAAFLEIRARHALLPDDSPLPDSLCLSPGYEAHARTLIAGLKKLGLNLFAAEDGDLPLASVARKAGMRHVAPDEAQCLISEEVSAEHHRVVAGVSRELEPGVIAPIAWHTSLKKYGAGEVNERYTAKTGREMDEAAYYGWLAVKFLVEAGLRGTPLHALRSDGHKGALLQFRNRRLKQPLYVCTQRELESEVIYV